MAPLHPAGTPVCKSRERLGGSVLQRRMAGGTLFANTDPLPAPACFLLCPVSACQDTVDRDTPASQLSIIQDSLNLGVVSTDQLLQSSVELSVEIFCDV